MNLTIDRVVVKKINLLFKIEEAFCWEGDASIYFNNVVINDELIALNLKVSGSSTVEHDGDIDGINDQVTDLTTIGEKTVIWDKQTYNVKIGHTNVIIDSEGKVGDGDYTVHVNGNVIILISKSE